MGEMRWLDDTGDSKIIWDPESEVEVDAARKQFDTLVAAGYKAFSVKKDGDKGKEITKFDAEAGKIIMTPGLRGG